jgi:hypothetical protein
LFIAHRRLAGKLHNPLDGISKEQLMRDVDLFCREKGLNDQAEYIRKGALVAQRPHDIDNIHELTSEERDILHYEKAHRWHHPKCAGHLLL